MARLIGALGSDWLKRHGNQDISDDKLRDWRDFLESKLAQDLGLEPDLGIGERTFFQFIGESETHTVIEVESFARKALDVYLSSLRP
jgi:hypothetical protein